MGYLFDDIGLSQSTSQAAENLSGVGSFTGGGGGGGAEQITISVPLATAPGAKAASTPTQSAGLPKWLTWAAVGFGGLLLVVLFIRLFKRKRK